MRTNLRMTVMAVGVVALAACSGTTPDESTVTTSAPEVTVAASPASTSLSPTTTTVTTTTTVPVTTVPVTTTTTVSSEVVEVPALPAPNVDGTLGPTEWDGAATFPMSDGATVELMQAEGTLYVAVSGSEVGAVNVVMATPDQVMILHSSAALGSALYEPDAEEWRLAHGFSWCCRDRNDTADRLTLLDQEGWQANIGFTGDAGIVEYEIDLPWQDASIAVSSIRDEEDTGFWPAELSGEARLQLLGVPPEARSFNISEWRVLADGER